MAMEGTNLSVGRDTPDAFPQIGAPWLGHEELVRRLRRRRLPGVRFTPTDRGRYDPTVAAVAVPVEIQRMRPDPLSWREGQFDRLAGTGRLRDRITAGASVERITRPWSARLERFREVRSAYLLY